jgi:hypothetical protein
MIGVQVVGPVARLGFNDFISLKRDETFAGVCCPCGGRLKIVPVDPGQQELCPGCGSTFSRSHDGRTVGVRQPGGPVVRSLP